MSEVVNAPTIVDDHSREGAKIRSKAAIKRDSKLGHSVMRETRATALKNHNKVESQVVNVL